MLPWKINIDSFLALPSCPASSFCPASSPCALWLSGALALLPLPEEQPVRAAAVTAAHNPITTNFSLTFHFFSLFHLLNVFKMLRLYIVELLRLYRRRLFPALLYLYSLINENSGKRPIQSHLSPYSGQYSGMPLPVAPLFQPSRICKMAFWRPEAEPQHPGRLSASPEPSSGWLHPSRQSEVPDSQEKEWQDKSGQPKLDRKQGGLRLIESAMPAAT